jgi:hypothetical protein
MATSYPGSLQDLDATRGTAGQPLSSPSHVTHHTLEDDTTEALQAKVGADSSAVTTSHDYKLSGVTGSDKAVSKTGSETLTNKVLTSPTITTGIAPTSNDGAALGTTSLQFSDVFLASGAVINFNNGDVTITHASNLLSYAGGQFTFGANTAYFTETDNGNSGAADTIDWTLSNKQKSTLTGSVTYTFTAPGGPCSLILKVLTGAGSFTATWPGTVKWSAGSAPVITATAGRMDLICFYYDGTDYFGTFSQNYTP